jgi:thiosulfate/3-mercaptopyruvate sulfurtransferase
MRHLGLARRALVRVIAGVAGLALVAWPGVPARGQTSAGTSASAGASASAESLPQSALVEPQDLEKTLQSSTGAKPLILQIGFDVLYRQGHIPGSEYAGPGSKEDGLQGLRKRLESVPRDKFIVLYCGCCPWDHCPNVKPAYDAVREMGFRNVRVMHVDQNFGTNWINQGFPVAKGQ